MQRLGAEPMQLQEANSGCKLFSFSRDVGPRGLMDKASDFESEDCEFESRRGQLFLFAFSFQDCQRSFGVEKPLLC